MKKLAILLMAGAVVMALAPRASAIQPLSDEMLDSIQGAHFAIEIEVDDHSDGNIITTTSVFLDLHSQAHAAAFNLINSADAAVNAGTQIAVGEIHTGTQLLTQIADSANSGHDIDVTNHSDDNLIEASNVVLIQNAQDHVDAFTLLNAANGAYNVGTQIQLAGVHTKDQTMDQTAINGNDGIEITVDNHSDGNDIFTTSVFIGGDAQKHADAFHLINVADAAVNVGTQIASAGTHTGEQTLTQTAINANSRHDIEVDDHSDLNDIWASNVLVSDHAQTHAVTFTLLNAVNGAYNIGTQIQFVGASGVHTKNQTMTQTATNF